MSKVKNYRRDIDGLRAVAILPVLLFHMGFRYTPGGFVGVDVFFVISGYLITGHIVSELDGGKFSLSNFYERRIRRIAPALVAMLAASSLAAYLLLLPEKLIDFEKSLLATLLSVSNIFFWLTANYFSSDDKPLLHTWSLAVEEQFYLVVPLLLMFIYKVRRQWLGPILIGIAVASLVLSAFTVRAHQDATFYLLSQRAWELLIGSLFGLNIVRVPGSRPLREAFAAIGLLLIAGAVLYVPASWIFPGPAVLLPCLGAGLILGAGARGPTFTGRLLSIRPLVGIGLISYSTYLWHLPIIVFQQSLTRVVFGKVFSRLFPFLSYAQAITLERIVLLSVLSLLCGALSWKFVEQPFRFGRLRPARPLLFRQAAVAFAVLAIASVSVLAAHGLPRRFSPEVLAITSKGGPAVALDNGVCFAGAGPEFDSAHCKPMDTQRPNWLLIGDSLAGQLDYGFLQAFPEVNLMHLSIRGCKPVPVAHYGEKEACLDAYARFYSDYLVSHHFDEVILSANWQAYDIPRITQAIQRLDQLHQKAVVVGPIMRYDTELRLLLADAVSHQDPSLPDRHRVVAFDDLDRQMAVDARDLWHVPYFSYAVLCPQAHCQVWTSKDVAIQWDDIHLQNGGSVLVAKLMRDEKFLIP